MFRLIAIFFLFVLAGCGSVKKVIKTERHSNLDGSEFYKQAAAMAWKSRDSFVVKEILSGNIPDYFKKFRAVHTSYYDSATGKQHKAIYYVSPDYLSAGTDADWVRVCITPMAAQQIADRFNCFFPTRKMVNAIYSSAKVKLEPVPMYAFRDSTPTMWQHHLIIEGQRKGRKGLIAGVKKDVVISGKISRDTKPGRVAIYGWHKQDGKPIQPLYTGHVNWWVDYSQGIRLIYRKIKIDGKWMDYIDILKHPVLKNLLCDEEFCNFYRY